MGGSVSRSLESAFIVSGWCPATVASEKAYTFSVDVARGVHVSVETDATGAALKDTITEGELGSRLATVRTSLRRGVEPVDNDHAVVAVLGFVGELASHLVEPGVEDGAR